MDIKKVEISNWSFTHIRKNKTFMPKNVNDLKKFVIFAKNENLKIIPKGSSLSYNDQIFINNGVVIDTKKLNKIIKINYSKKFIKVESGCELGSIIKLINKKKYTIGAIAGAHGISIGGAVTNNVHGKDSKFFGAFLNNIIEIKVLLTNGKEKFIKKKDIPKILNFGLFYIITEVKLKLLKIKSDKILTKKITFNNLKEMEFILSTNQDPFMYGWIDFYSKDNRGYIETGKFISTKKNIKKNYLTIFFLFLFNKLSFFLKYFVNPWAMAILNNVIFFLVKKFNKSITNLYDFYYPLQNIELNKFFRGGIIELQILIEERNFKKKYVSLKKLLEQYKISSYFMGIKCQKNENLKLSFYKKGISISIVFSKNTINNINFKKFKFSLKKLLDNQIIFLNLTKDHLFDNLKVVKNNKSLFLKYKKKYDKNNMLQSNFGKRHKLIY